MITVNIYSSSIDTPLGRVTLFADGRGLTGIVLPGTERRELSSWYPDAGRNQILDEAARQIMEYLDGRRTVFSLPLSLTGTPFRLRVWEEIGKIPYGRTASYRDIALRLGHRNKARAVGGAANANPLPLIIPCHRVIGADGNLTGFAGGLGMKKKLLRLEGMDPVP
ncbi:MAG TPA: methylated-DNA--[protein]-cysteine S-methyltransferase [Desulfobacteraceae bacterium]|nr:methylated-DNA--[protein]-cysteine S-methyltransferase [Desulfobacteraceae bacterium]